MDKKPRKVVLTERPYRKVTNPALWIGLICIPLVFGLLVGLGQDAEDETLQENPRIAAPATPISGQRAGAFITADNTVIAPALPTRPRAVSCDFAPWVGRKVSEDMLESIKGADGGQGRPYRILPPGSMMTMDHSPARINFDLDEAGIITRVWCG